MDDEVWPPPPKGQPTPDRHVILPDVDVSITDDSVTLTFTSLRRINNGMMVVYFAIWILWYLVTNHHANSNWNQVVSAPLLWISATWFSFDFTTCRGRYTLKVDGTVIGGSTLPRHWRRIRYLTVRPNSVVRSRFCLCIVMSERVRPAWGANRGQTNVIWLPPVEKRDDAERVAKLVSDHLGVPIFDD